MAADRGLVEFGAEGEGEMIENGSPSIFTIEIGDTPTLAFEAQNLREANELCHEQWLKDDLAEAKSNGVPCAPSARISAGRKCPTQRR